MGPQAGQRFHDAHAHGWLGHTHACSHADALQRIELGAVEAQSACGPYLRALLLLCRARSTILIFEETTTLSLGFWPSADSNAQRATSIRSVLVMTCLWWSRTLTDFVWRAFRADLILPRLASGNRPEFAAAASRRTTPRLLQPAFWPPPAPPLGGCTPWSYGDHPPRFHSSGEPHACSSARRRATAPVRRPLPYAAQALCKLLLRLLLATASTTVRLLLPSSRLLPPPRFPHAKGITAQGERVEQARHQRAFEQAQRAKAQRLEFAEVDGASPEKLAVLTKITTSSISAATKNSMRKDALDVMRRMRDLEANPVDPSALKKCAKCKHPRGSPSPACDAAVFAWAR